MSLQASKASAVPPSKAPFPQGPAGPRPRLACAAVRPAVLGALGWLLLVAALYASAFGWLSVRHLREVMRGDDPLSGELDESLACDLVTDFVAERESYRKVKCLGSLVSTSEAARLAGVKVDWDERTARRSG